MTKKEKLQKDFRYKVGPVDGNNLYYRELEFVDIAEAKSYQKELMELGTQEIVIKEIVIDKQGEFVGWKRYERIDF